MEDLFNLNPNDFSGSAGSTRKVDENLYNPGPDQGQNGVYKSIIRFIPWAQDPSKSKYKKYSAKLQNPLTNEKLFVDCPSTTGAPSILWSLDTELKNLKDSDLRSSRKSKSTLTGTTTIFLASILNAIRSSKISKERSKFIPLVTVSITSSNRSFILNPNS